MKLIMKIIQLEFIKKTKSIQPIGRFLQFPSESTSTNCKFLRSNGMGATIGGGNSTATWENIPNELPDYSNSTNISQLLVVDKDNNLVWRDRDLYDNWSRNHSYDGFTFDLKYYKENSNLEIELPIEIKVLPDQNSSTSNKFLKSNGTSTTLIPNNGFENYDNFAFPGSGYQPLINPSTSSAGSNSTTITGWSAYKPANHEYNNVYLINNNNTAFGSQAQLGSVFVGMRGVTLTQNRILKSGTSYRLTWYEKTRPDYSASGLTVKVNNTTESATHTLTTS